MLVNPTPHSLKLIEGTRFLEDPIGLPGVAIRDPLEPDRPWYVQWVLAPVPGRLLGGVRAKLTDSKGFITFVNQRDLEVLLGMAKPGQYCKWLGQDYVGPTDPDWYGLCCDDEDLRDDLFERECIARRDYPGVLPQGLELTRRLHIDFRQDVEQLDTLLWDWDPDSYLTPDPRLETVHRRWTRVERTPLIWERL
jgi:hypothetical protein